MILKKSNSHPHPYIIACKNRKQIFYTQTHHADVDARHCVYSLKTTDISVLQPTLCWLVIAKHC